MDASLQGQTALRVEHLRSELAAVADQPAGMALLMAQAAGEARAASAQVTVALR